MLLKLIAFAGIAGVTVILGALLAFVFDRRVSESQTKEQIVHGLISFGGGILLSAVVLVLVPRGMDSLTPIPLSIYFMSGAITFCILDWYLSKKGDKTANLLAMLMDFIPESIALGAVFAGDMTTAKLLAIFIGLQNFPEAFNAFRDLKSSGFRQANLLLIFFALSFSGIGGALLGYYLLQDHPQITAGLMVFASGGILYLLFQDIIPESSLKSTYVTSLGATIGFLVGILGTMYIH